VQDQSKPGVSSCVSTCYVQREVNNVHNDICRNELCGGPDFRGIAGSSCEAGTECQTGQDGLLTCQYPPAKTA